jgi:hypothetical protein
MPGHTRYVAAGKHPMAQHIHVAGDEVVAGDHFPVVWRRPA